MVSTTLSTPIKVAPSIFVYENVLSQGKEFVDMVELETKNEWSPLKWGYSETGNGQVSEYRSSQACMLRDITYPCADSLISKVFNNVILKEIKTCLNDYSLYHNIVTSTSEVWSLLKYEGEAQYRTHWDHDPHNSRVVSVVAFPYSTADVGGDLSFPFFDVSIKPKTGSIAIFPSNFPYTHTAHPVEQGLKYSLVTWFK